MANENEKNDFEDDQLNLDDIEGLERDDNLEEHPSGDDASKDEKSSDSQSQSATTDDLDALDDINEQHSKKEESSKQKLLARLKSTKPIIKYSILGLIVLLFIIIIILLSGSSNESKRPPLEQKNQDNTPATNALNNIKVPQYEFKLDHINVARLNKELEYLNKYELLGMTEEEYLKQKRLEELKAKEAQLELERQKELEQARLEKARLEQERLEKERQEQEKLEQAKQKEEQEKNANEQKEAVNEEDTEKNTTNLAAKAITLTPDLTPQNSDHEFIRLIKLQTNKRNIFKNELLELKKVDGRIHPCRNIHNQIELFIGPLNDNDDENAIMNRLKESTINYSASVIELTNDEFKKRCMAY
jgi:hypothetical protein